MVTVELLKLMDVVFKITNKKQQKKIYVAEQQTPDKHPPLHSCTTDTIHT